MTNRAAWFGKSKISFTITFSIWTVRGKKKKNSLPLGKSNFRRKLTTAVFYLQNFGIPKGRCFAKTVEQRFAAHGRVYCSCQSPPPGWRLPRHCPRAQSEGPFWGVTPHLWEVSPTSSSWAKLRLPEEEAASHLVKSLVPAGLFLPWWQ